MTTLYRDEQSIAFPAGEGTYSSPRLILRTSGDDRALSVKACGTADALYSDRALTGRLIEVVERHTGDTAGYIRLYILEGGRGIFSHEVLPAHRGKAYGVEIVKALVDMAFGAYGLASLEAVIDRHSLPCQYILRRCGFDEKGSFTARNAEGQARPSLRYARVNERIVV